MNLDKMTSIRRNMDKHGRFHLKTHIARGQKPTFLLGTIYAVRYSTGRTGVLLSSISHSMGLTPNWIAGLFLVGPHASNCDQFVLISSGLKSKAQFRQFMPQLRTFINSRPYKYGPVRFPPSARTGSLLAVAAQAKQLVDPLGVY